MFNQADIETANATSRGKGFIGRNAVVPRAVRAMLDSQYNTEVMILDFGAGKEALHARALQEDGWACTAYEFGNNVDVRYHNELALMQQYDIVYASNVLNVQTCATMARHTISQIYDAVKEAGMFIANYPKSPRKSDITPKEMEQLLLERFKMVERVAGSAAAPCWVINK